MKLKTILAAGAAFSIVGASAFAGLSVSVPDSGDDKIAGVLLGLFLAYVVGSSLMGGSSVSTKGVDERMSKDKGKLLDRY